MDVDPRCQFADLNFDVIVYQLIDSMPFPLNRVVLSTLAEVDFLALLALTGSSATLLLYAGSNCNHCMLSVYPPDEPICLAP
jgi:hypothetical protein